MLKKECYAFAIHLWDWHSQQTKRITQGEVAGWCERFLLAVSSFRKPNSPVKEEHLRKLGSEVGANVLVAPGGEVLLLTSERKRICWIPK